MSLVCAALTVMYCGLNFGIKGPYRVQTVRLHQMKQQFPFNLPNLTVMEIWAIFKEDLKQILFKMARIHLKTSKKRPDIHVEFSRNHLLVGSQWKSLTEYKIGFDWNHWRGLTGSTSAKYSHILLLNATNCSPRLVLFNFTVWSTSYETSWFVGI